MKKALLLILFCVFPTVAMAEINSDTDKVTLEFSKAMGIDHIIESTLEQTRNSLKSNMIDLSSRLKSQHPNLNKEKSIELDNIFNSYIDTIINSVDPETASRIYANVIANGLTDKEIREATDYYNSPQGKNLLKIINVGAQKLNEYILNQMGEATKQAQSQLINRLGKYQKSLEK